MCLYRVVPFRSFWKIVAQSVGQEETVGTHFGEGDWRGILKSFYLLFGLIVPENHVALWSDGENEFLVSDIESNWVDWV